MARLAVLDTELNMGISKPQEQAKDNIKVSKQEKPSVLDSIKQATQFGKEVREKQSKYVEVR